MSQQVLERLQQQFGSAIVEAGVVLGDAVAVVAADKLLEIARFLKDDPACAFNLPIDNTAVDFWGKREPRFDLVWHFYSTQHGHRLRLKARVAEETCVVDSLTPLWPGLDWHERETWDMYGIRFRGHPNLKRVLMYEEFQGHPLRKDYPIDRRQPLLDERVIAAEVPTQRHPPASRLNRP